ncbi:MAG: recombinase family protein [Luteolibacter sp.]
MAEIPLRPAVSYLRFSSPEQALGDSKRRQNQGTEAYCAANGFRLLDVFFDQGVSGFRGRHRRKGRLADLIDAARKGKFPRGTALIIESLDRLSREQVSIALQQFLELINDHGLEIHTIGESSRQIYHRDRLDLGSLVVSIVEMSRAHGESQRKSELIAASWKGLRLRGVASSRPDKKPMGRFPSWLEWKDGKWIVIEERASVLRHIFHDLVLGKRLGRYEVARTLVEEKALYWSKKGDGWTASGVKRVITNPALTGDLVPAKSGDPDAATVPTYYPTVIDRETYDEVQRLIAARKSGGGRPRAQHTQAILTGFSFVENKRMHRGYSKQPSGNHQLNYSYVDVTNRNRYFASGAILENVVVRGLMLLSFSDVLSGDDTSAAEKRSRRKELVEERQVKETAIANFVAAIGQAGDGVVELTRAMTAARSERDRLTREIEAIDAEISMATGGNVEEAWNRLGELLDAALVEQKEEARAEVRSILMRLIKRIDLGRRDKDNWWRHFPAWAGPHLDFMCQMNSDPENNIDYIDDEEPGTPPPLKPKDKIIAVVEFWNGQRVLLRNGLVLPC